MRTRALRALTAIIAAAAVLAAGTGAAEEIKLGTSRLLAYVAVPIMIEKGYLAAQGLNAELVTFDSAQPITVAVVSGDVDFGVGGLSAAFFNLAAEGKLRILAAGGREMPGFRNFAFIAASRAFAAGFSALKDVPGRSMGVTQLGTSLQYSLGRAAEKYALDFKSIRVSPMQSNTNLVAAITGNQLDGGVVPAGLAQPGLDRGDMKLLAWVGDEVPGIQNNVVFTAPRTADERPDLVRRFVAAYRQAARLYHDAVADAAERRRDGPALSELLPLLAGFAKLSPAEAKAALPWLDAGARVDRGDLAHQIAWFRSQGMVKGEVEADRLIDHRYATTLPAP